MTHPPEPQPLSAEEWRLLKMRLSCNITPDREETDRMIATISTRTAERDAALANALPAGCVAACRMCGKNAAWYGLNCEAANCPLMRRLGAAISAAAKTTQEPT